MDVGVRGGRMNGGICKDEELPLLSQVFCSIDLREEGEGSAKEELEEISGEALFKELSKLSQHEELQDLEPHGGKVV